MTKLRFMFAVPGMPFEGDTLKHKSLGGSETAALCMARELQAIGHSVVVFCNGKPGVYDGVQYAPLDAFAAASQMIPHDVCVVQRVPEMFCAPKESRLNLLWCHDLALRRATNQFRGALWNVDKAVVVSEFMAGQYKEVYSLPDEAIYVTRNGIDLDLIPHTDLPRDKKALVYTSRPERGMDILLDRIFPELLRRDPYFRLYLAAYDNPVQHLAPLYADMQRKIDALRPHITIMGALTKPNLYDLYSRSGVLVYPTPSKINPEFREVSCITAMEAMACGLPIVTSDLGALPETIAKGAGRLIEGDPYSDKYLLDFCDAVMNYVCSPEQHEDASKSGRKEASKLSWTGVAKQWADDCERLIEERNEDKERLARHFVRRSNIILAKDVIKDVDTPSAKMLKDRIAREWAFLDSPDGYKSQYTKVGDIRPKNVWEGGSKEARLQHVIEWLRKHKECRKIVDVGCGLGIYAVNISNAIPEIEITGVDIDKQTIAHAEQIKADHALYPGNITFVVGREDEPLSGFDMAFAGEVLEHLPEPWDFLTKLEGMVKPGGWIYTTTPYGPWEEIVYATNQVREHLWELEILDFEDMIGHKQNAEIDYAPCTLSTLTNEPLGHVHTRFKADGQPIRKIDLERKKRLQRPRQTLSVNIIAGSNPDMEDLGRRCLKSVRAIADEVIIGDCGMSPRAMEIAKEYADLIVGCPSPLDEGFETPRNKILEYSSMDWVMWIDTDEFLMTPSSLPKFLRRNVHPGYSVAQHHLAVDTTFPPDLPVRIFRRKRSDGKVMRFYGMIHEHPETGLNEGPGEILILPDLKIAHVGYLTEPVRRLRFVRNSPLLDRDIEKYPERILQKLFIMRDNGLKLQYLLQQTNGVITDEMRVLAEETVFLHREHFHGKKLYQHIDPLQYYSQALLVLGKGIDVKMDLRAARDGIGDNLDGPAAPVSARFASVDEAVEEAARIIKEKFKPLEGAYW